MVLTGVPGEVVGFWGAGDEAAGQRNWVFCTVRLWGAGSGGARGAAAPLPAGGIFIPGFAAPALEPGFQALALESKDLRGSPLPTPAAGQGTRGEPLREVPMERLRSQPGTSGRV